MRRGQRLLGEKDLHAVCDVVAAGLGAVEMFGEDGPMRIVAESGCPGGGEIGPAVRRVAIGCGVCWLGSGMRSARCCRAFPRGSSAQAWAASRTSLNAV